MLHAKFQDKNKINVSRNFYFQFARFYITFQTSGVLCAEVLIDVLIHSADEYTLAMTWVGYAHMQLKTLLR